MNQREIIQTAIDSLLVIENRALCIEDNLNAVAARATMKELRAILDAPGISDAELAHYAPECCRTDCWCRAIHEGEPGKAAIHERRV